MRYDTLKQLRDAYRQNEVDGDLVLDNDSAGVYDGGVKVFEMHPADLLFQALDLLGIPYGSA